MSPDKFLSAAERYQLAPAIDRWVVTNVFELAAASGGRYGGRRNFRRQHFRASRWATRSSRASSRRRLRTSATCPCSLLSFEVTETAAVANIVRAEALIRRLRELGCDVALDDFGRGLSSLTYLKILPVTALKIDGSFVRDVVGDERSQAMLSAIVQLARAMKLQTVAECVESEQIREIIRGLGVEYGQGFSIGRPVPLTDVINGLVGAKLVHYSGNDPLAEALQTTLVVWPRSPPVTVRPCWRRAARRRPPVEAADTSQPPTSCTACSTRWPSRVRSRIRGQRRARRSSRRPRS